MSKKSVRHTVFLKKRYRSILAVLLNVVMLFGLLPISNVTATASTVAVQIVPGYSQTYALMGDGSVQAWGANTYGQLGIDNTTDKYAPTVIPGLTGVKKLFAGAYHGFAIMNDGTVKAWGRNAYGQLGFGDTTARWLPETVTGLTGVNQLFLGQNNTYAIMNNGTVKAWGMNTSGQLGIGNTTTPQTLPVTISGLTGVSQIVSGDNITVGQSHTLALMNDGTVKAWGYNIQGQLGIGNTTPQISPVDVTGLVGVKQLASGGINTLALLNDGTVKAWGSNSYGQLGDNTTVQKNSPVVVPGLTNVKQLASGQFHSVALMNDGSVKTWGDNGCSELGIGNTTDQYIPTVVTSLTGVKQIMAGEYHNYALMTSPSGVVQAWGNNANGELGIGSTTAKNPYNYGSGVPVTTTMTFDPTNFIGNLPPAMPTGLVTSNVTPTAVTLSWTSSVNATSYRVYNNGTLISSPTSPTVTLSSLIPNTSYSFTVVASSSLEDSVVSATLAVSTPSIPIPATPTGLAASGVTQTAVTLNWNASTNATSYNIYANGSLLDSSTTNFDTISYLVAGTSYTFTVTAVNTTGESSPSTSIGITTTGVRPLALQVVTGHNFSLALMNDGTVEAWGYNPYGQLGIGNTIQQNYPVTIPGLTGVKQLFAGFGSSFALMNDGTVKTWGWNAHGQLGIGNLPNQMSPITLSGLTGVSHISIGSVALCAFALMNDGTVKAWGYNGDGELGIGNTTNQYYPVSLSGLSDLKQLVTGYNHTFALMNDGTVKAWGFNAYGQLGLGNVVTPQVSPITVTALTGVKKLFAGSNYGLAIINDGTVKAWGDNAYGQLGLGNVVTPQTLPITISGLTGVYQLVAADHSSFALMNDGTVKVWGDNINVSLGIGNTTQQNSPVTISGLTDVRKLVTGGYHTIALMNNGTVQVWGHNAEGELGLGYTTPDSPYGLWVPTLNPLITIDANNLIDFPPSTPTGLASSSITQTSVNLTWSEASTDVTYYNVYKDGVLYSNPSTNAASVTGLTEGTAYTFTVIAVNTNGESRMSIGLVVNTLTSSSVPTIEIGSPSSVLTKSGPITYTLTYTEADTVNLTSGNITLNKTGTANGTVNVTNGTTNTPTVTISAITGNGTLGISIVSGSSSKAGVFDAGVGPSTTFIVDNIAPIVTGVIEGGIYNTSKTITFDEGTATLNGGAFTSGSQAVAEGAHTLIVTDAAGNSTTVTFTIDKTLPTNPSISIDPTTSTNGNVTVTIVFAGDATVKSYNINGGESNSYTAPFTVSSNCTVNAASADAAGNWSGEVSYVINNINIADTTPPTNPIISIDPTTSTNGNVTVTITYAGDATVKSYNINGGESNSYTAPFTVSSNCTVNAASADAAGNWSGEVSYVINNINIADTTPPTNPIISIDPTTSTSGNVTVTITYAGDATVKSYNINGGESNSYTAPFTISSNCTVNAASADAAGNWSGEVSYVISNINVIDNTPPTVNVPIETHTSISITATANATDISTPLQYLFNIGEVDQGTWQDSNSYVFTGLTASTAYSIKYKAKDSVGNISDYSTVLNVTTLAPTTSQAGAVTIMELRDLTNNDNASDIRVLFRGATNESNIASYKIIVSKGTIDEATASELPAARYMAVAKKGNLRIYLTCLPTALITSSGGSINAAGGEYNVYVLSVGKTGYSDKLSTPLGITITTNNAGHKVTAPTPTVADSANNGNGTDIKVSIRKPKSEVNIEAYRIIVSTTDLTLATAQSVNATGYTEFTPTTTGISYIKLMGAEQKDNSGTAIQNGIAYKVYVLAIGKNGYVNVLSSPSKLITLSQYVPATNAVKSLRISKVGSGHGSANISVSFYEPTAVSNVQEYRILISPSESTLSQAEADGISDSALYQVVATTGRGRYHTVTLDTGKSDYTNATLVAGKYKVYVLTVGKAGFSGKLSGASANVTLD